MKKRLILLTIYLFLILNISVVEASDLMYDAVTIRFDNCEHNYLDTHITVKIDDVIVLFDNEFPVIVDNRTLVPIREIMEHIGASVTWVEASKEIIIENDGLIIQLEVDNQEAFINGEKVMIDVPPKLMTFDKNTYAKTMIPIRFITEALNYQVEWNNDDQQVLLQSNDYLESKSYKDYEDEIDNPTTSIKDVSYYKYQDRYVIKAESAMSSIKYYVWDGKLIIDMDNTDIGDVDKDIDIFKNAFVSKVRSSQFSYQPLVSRVVFDLVEGTLPTYVEISEDRKEISVVFGNDGLNNIVIESNDSSDYIKISGEYSDMNIFRLDKPERVVIDLENAISPYEYLVNDTYLGNYITTYRIAQFNETTTRIVVEVDGDVDYNINSNEEGLTYIEIGKISPSEPIEEDIDKFEELLVIDNIAEGDLIASYDYINKQVTFTMDQDAGFTVEDIAFRDSAIVKEIVGLENGLQVTTDHIYEYLINYSGTSCSIKVARPRDLFDKIVIIDSGHGGKDPGTNHGERIEKNYNLTMTNYMQELVGDQTDIKYYFVRSEDTYISLDERVEMANDIQADLFVSVHNNAMDIEIIPAWVNIKGLEVHITDNTEQSEFENELALSLLEEMKNVYSNRTYRGVKISNDFYVLKNTYMPSILIEYGYITNEEDARFLDDIENLQGLSEITIDTIQQFFK